MDFERPCELDCVYSRGTGSRRVWLLVYVDDFILMGENRETIDTVKDDICKYCKMTDEGSLKACPGVEIRHEKEGRTIIISQKGDILKLLENFNMGCCKPVSTPIEKD